MSPSEAAPEEARALSRYQWWAFIGGGLSLALVVGLALRSGFVCDDYLQLFELHRPLGEILHEYFGAPARYGYHRPLAWLLHWLLGRLDGANPVIFHAASLLGAGLAVAGVYRLTRILSRRKDLAFWAAMVFAVRFTHPEAVVWVSGLGDVWMTAAFVWACVYAVRCGENFSWRFTVCALVLYIIALMFKETALALPVLVFIAFVCRRAWRRNLRWLLFLLVLVTGGWMVWRALIGATLLVSPAALSINPAVIGRNLAFYVAQMVFPWRTVFTVIGYEKYEALKTVFPIRLTDPLMLSIIAVMGLSIVGLVFRLRRRIPAMVWTGVVLCGVTLFPFTTLGGTALRFLFLPSVGLSMIIAGWLPRNGPRYKLVSAILVLVVIGSGVLLAERAFWWERGGAEGRQLIAATEQLLATTGPEKPLWIRDIPRRRNGAFVFPIGYMGASRFHFGREGIRIIDGDLVAARGDRPPHDARFFRWNGQRLILDDRMSEK